MAKKMSVEEILAAAKAGKKPAESAPAPAAPAAEAASESPAAAAPEAASAEDKPAAPNAAVKPGSMSVADILAAAKAGKKPAAAAAAPAPAAPKPVAPVAEKKPAPPKTDAAVAAAVPKDTASILAAARKGAKPGPISKAEAEAKGIAPAPAGKKKLEAPPMPAKPAFAQPAVAAKGAAATESRRGFFSAAMGVVFGSSLAIGFTSLAVTHLMWVLGLARFMFPNILTEPPTRFKVGPPSNFGPGQVETKFIPEFGVWVVRYEFDGRAMIYALKAVCTHLGCTPNWLEAEQKFKCPCHGSGFYKDGINFEGPAPRPLERYAISLADDGQLEIDKSRTFSQEQGQWKDSASYVPV